MSTDTQTPSPRPVIGISIGLASASALHAMISQVAASGGTPLFLGNYAERDPAADIDKIDALVVMGNDGDIDPERYGQPRHPATNAESDTPEGKLRADYEYAIMEKAVETGMPILGICGGMQRLNTICGGELHQHVPDLTGHDDHAQRNHSIAPFIAVQPVHLSEGSTLAEIGGGNHTIYVPDAANNPDTALTYLENSMHHQAVKTVGNGLRACAHAEDVLPDGSHLIEAVEADPEGPYKDQFMMCVQWHPEFSASELGPKITARLTDEGRKYAVENARTHPPEEARQETILSASNEFTPDANKTKQEGGMVESILRRRETAASSEHGI